MNKSEYSLVFEIQLVGVLLDCKAWERSSVTFRLCFLKMAHAR